MLVRKLITALLIIGVVFAPISGQSFQTTSRDVIGRAQSSYYNLTKHNFNGFNATIEPNWNVILGHTATPQNLKVFRAVQFSMMVDASGTVTVQYEITDSEKRRLESTIKQIHKNMQGLVEGFFNTWRMFMIGSPFGASESETKIEDHVGGHRLSYSMQSTDVMLTMTKDFRITEWKLTSSAAIRTVRPQFQKTPEGLLLIGYDGDFQPVGAGIRTDLNFSIEYQNVKGMQLPHIIRFKGMHGSEPVAAELTFNQYVLNPSPANHTSP